MRTKTFTIIKTAYSAGTYGCSGEYFTCIYTFIEKVKGNEYNGGKDFERINFDSFKFEGMYGTEERVREEMEKKGFYYTYTNGNYGKIGVRDVYKSTKREYEAIAYIKNNFKEEGSKI